MLVKVEVGHFDALVDAMPLPLYVVVVGGYGVGKTHVVRRHLTRFVVADIDDHMVRNGFTDYSRDGDQFKQCMNEIDAVIQQHKAERRSMVAIRQLSRRRLKAARPLTTTSSRARRRSRCSNRSSAFSGTPNHRARCRCYATVHLRWPNGIS